MPVEYDKYYQTENLFGKPYPELIDFYTSIAEKGTLLDVGCGQGRDAIPLAKLGFTVTGIDNSTVGIRQLNKIAVQENLPLKGVVEDIYNFEGFDKFDFILLDSMLHFGKKERTKETDFLNRLIAQSSPETYLTICIQKTGKKVAILKEILAGKPNLVTVHQTELIYIYEDSASNHRSESTYEMITLQKVQADAPT